MMSTPEIENELIKYQEKQKEKKKSNIRRNIGLGLLFGFIIAMALVGLDALIPKAKEIILMIVISLFGAVMGTVATFAYLELKTIKEEKDVDLFYVSNKIKDSVFLLEETVNSLASKLEAGTIYSELISQHLNLNWRLSQTFSSIVKEMDRSGGIVISAEWHNYFAFLKNILLSLFVDFGTSFVTSGFLSFFTALLSFFCTLPFFFPI